MLLSPGRVPFNPGLVAFLSAGFPGVLLLAAGFYPSGMVELVLGSVLLFGIPVLFYGFVGSDGLDGSAGFEGSDGLLGSAVLLASAGLLGSAVLLASAGLLGSDGLLGSAVLLAGIVLLLAEALTAAD